NYNALQLQAERPLFKNFSILGSYTWSKSIDDTSSLFGATGDPAFPQNSYNLKNERGLSDFDTRKRLSVSGTYSLPGILLSTRGGLSAAAHTVADGWRLSTIVAA